MPSVGSSLPPAYLTFSTYSTLSCFQRLLLPMSQPAATCLPVCKQLEDGGKHLASTYMYLPTLTLMAHLPLRIVPSYAYH